MSLYHKLIRPRLGEYPLVQLLLFLTQNSLVLETKGLIMLRPIRIELWLGLASTENMDGLNSPISHFPIQD